jgi:hypothetical protein
LVSFLLSRFLSRSAFFPLLSPFFVLTSFALQLLTIRASTVDIRSSSAHTASGDTASEQFFPRKRKKSEGQRKAKRKRKKKSPGTISKTLFD